MDCAFVGETAVTVVRVLLCIIRLVIMSLWFRLHRPDWLEGVALVGATLLVVTWAFVELRSKPVLEAERAEGRKPFREQKGPRYRYVLTSLRLNGSKGSATVVAYDDSSVEDVEVSWGD